MKKTPDTDQFPFAPFQVFQYRLTPEKALKFYTKNIQGVKYRAEREVYSGGKRAADARAYHEIASKFNVPYYTSKIGGSLTRLNTTPDIFTIAIGVLNKNKMHESASFGGKYHTISYVHLFEALDSAGYRPLELLLENAETIEFQIEQKVDSIIRNTQSLSRETFRAALSVIARDWTDKVKDYIIGGDAPALSSTTIDIRKEKAKSNDSLYGGSKGVRNPLYETGNLCEAISFQVFVDQSQEMRSYIDRYKRGLKAEREFEKRFKRISERGAVHDFHGLDEEFWKSLGLSNGEAKRMSAAKKQRIRRTLIPFSDVSILSGLKIKTWKGASAKDIIGYLADTSATASKKGEENTFLSVFNIAYKLLELKNTNPYQYEISLNYAQQSGMIGPLELEIMREAINYARSKSKRI